MMKRLLLATATLSVSVIMAGCADPGYSCRLKDSSLGACSSTEQAYHGALRTSQVGPNQQSVFQPGSKASAKHSGQSPQVVIGQLSRTPGPGQTGMPVFQEPKVVRVWIAPFVDADGNLHSGEYQYFSTPGHWNYGSLKAPGQASGIFHPAMPGDYGFNPVTQSDKTDAPPAPPITAPTLKPQKTTGEAAPGGITQPYQKLVPPQ